MNSKGGNKESQQDGCSLAHDTQLNWPYQAFSSISPKFSFGGLRRITINISSRDTFTNYPPNVIQNSGHPLLESLIKAFLSFARGFTNKILVIFVLLDLAFYATESNSPPFSYLFSFFPILGSLTILLLLLAMYILCELICTMEQETQSQIQNDRLCDTLSMSGNVFHKTQWANLRVGQIVRLRNNEMVPADVVLLASSNSDGLVFVDTHFLNGETDLKKRYAVTETQGEIKFHTCCTLQRRLVCEQPMNRSESFKATMSHHAHPRVSTLDGRCFVLQGSILSGIDWAFAVVVYTGCDTYIAKQNEPYLSLFTSSFHHMKDRCLDVPYFLIACFITSSALLFVFRLIHYPQTTSFTTFGGRQVSLMKRMVEDVLMVLRLFPLSFSSVCYFARILQSFFRFKSICCVAENDIKIYNPIQCERLGQGDFIFMDKTGTLTDGRTMSFACLYIKGKVYGDARTPHVENKVNSKLKPTSMKETTHRVHEAAWSLLFKKKIYKKQVLLSYLKDYHIQKWFSISFPRVPSPSSHNVIMNRNAAKHFKVSSRHPCALRRCCPYSLTRRDYLRCSTLKRCFSSPSLRMFDSRSTHSFTEGSVEFRPIPAYLRKRTEFKDKRILYDLLQMNSRSRATETMLLAMSLCNSVVPTLDALTNLLHPDIQRKCPQRRIVNSPIGENLNTLRNPRDSLSVEDSSSTASVPHHITEEILWSRELSWNPSAVPLLKYNAQYPEEECIIAGCSSMGCRLLWRSSSLILLEKRQKIIRYEVLGCSAFNSTDQRMSIIVREENSNAVYLYCKGSDVSVLPLCSWSTEPSKCHKLNRVRRCVRWFSQNGLRTLVFARRLLSEEEKSAVQHLHGFVEILGVTGVRERVVPGARETICHLSLAGIRIWMVTGDHSDLSLHIAYASKILRPSTVVFPLRIQAEALSCTAAVRKKIRSLYARFESLMKTRHFGQQVALLISGPDVYPFLSSPDSRVIFCSMICCSDAVIFCRMVPQLKAQIVELLRSHLTPSPIIFAVGDGTNDIPMFQKADCGIAVLAAGQKCYAPCCTSFFTQVPSIQCVKTLLLVHGRLFNIRLRSTEAFLHYYGGTFFGGCVTLMFFTGCDSVKLQQTQLLFLCEFVFLASITCVHAITFLDIPPHLLDHLPWFYVLTRHEGIDPSLVRLTVVLRGFFTSLVSILVIGIPCLDLGGLHGSDLCFADFHVDVVTSLFVSCVLEVIVQSLSTLSRHSIVYYCCSILAWYLILFLGSFFTSFDFLHSFSFFHLSEDSIFFPRSNFFWIRQPYLLLVCCTVVVSSISLRRVFFPSILQHCYDSVQENYNRLLESSVASHRTDHPHEIFRQLAKICNPLRRQYLKCLPPPEVYQLVSNRYRGQRVHCTLPFFSDIDKLSMMLRLKHKDRLRFLTEQLVAPTLDLLKSYRPSHVISRKLTTSTLDKPCFSTSKHSTIPPTPRKSKMEKNTIQPPSGPMPLGFSTPTPSSPLSSLSAHSLVTDSDEDSLIPPFSSQSNTLHKKKDYFDFHSLNFKTSQIRDALYLISLRFCDPQLETDYQIYRESNGQGPTRLYCCIFFLLWVTSLLNLCWDIRSLFRLDHSLRFFVYYGIGSLLVDVLTIIFSLTTFYSYLFTKQFDFLLRFFCIACTISKEIVHYVNCDDGICFASIFSILTFIILRIPFAYALIQNVLFTLLFLTRYVFASNKCKDDGFNMSDFLLQLNSIRNRFELAELKLKRTIPLSHLVHYLPLFFGIQVLVGFIGYRLEYNERCGFLLTYQAQVARQKRREILNTMLPSFIVDEYLRAATTPDGVLKTIQPEHHDEVSVVFCDVHNFEKLIALVEPRDLIQVLDSLFLCFDKCVEYYQGDKVETVFETYLVATGLNTNEKTSYDTSKQHARVAIELSLAMLDISGYMMYKKKMPCDQFNEDTLEKRRYPRQLERIRVRIGIHSGPVICGIMGTKKPQYCLFGDTVNTASRMKSTGKPDRIHVSEPTYSLLKHDEKYTWIPRHIHVKGIGLMNTYLLHPFSRDTLNPRSCPAWVSSFSMFEGSSNPLVFSNISSKHICAHNQVVSIPQVFHDIPVSHSLVFPTDTWTPKPNSPLASSSSIASCNFSFSHPNPPVQRSLCAYLLRYYCSFCFFGVSPSTPEGSRFDYPISTTPIDPPPAPPSPAISDFRLSGRILRFENIFVEQEYRSQFYSSELNLCTIEQAVVLFLILFLTETWAVFLIPQKPFGKSLENIIQVHWPTRLVFSIVLFLFWRLLRHRFSPFISKILTRHLLISFLNLILVAAGSSIIMINVLSSIIVPLDDHDDDNYSLLMLEKRSTLLSLKFFLIANHFSWYSNDILQFFFYVTILHNCSGLLFSQVIPFSITLVTMFSIFIVINFFNHITSSIASISIFFLLVNLISAYIKESVDRTVFVANEELKLTEKRAQKLLEDMLPCQILYEYQQDRLKLAYKHKGMSFLFADICHFTPWAKQAEAREVIQLLQLIFYQFDDYASCFGLFKLCTIGDAYVVVTEPVVSKKVSNCTVALNARRIVKMAAAMVSCINSIRSRNQIRNLSMRIGLHCGDCYGGLIGSGRLRYDLWGCDVLTANMMERIGVSGKICVSEPFRTILNKQYPGQFKFSFHSSVKVCGDRINSYLLVSAPKDEMDELPKQCFHNVNESDTYIVPRSFIDPSVSNDIV